MGMSITDIYTTRSGSPGGPAANSPNPGAAVTQQVSAPTIGVGKGIQDMTAGGIAPTISWLALVGVLVGIRILWNMGARPGESIVG